VLAGIVGGVALALVLQRLRSGEDRYPEKWGGHDQHGRLSDVQIIGE
jgi:hypothetical protein